MYTRSMETIYLSLVHTGSRGYLFHEIHSIKTLHFDPYLLEGVVIEKEVLVYI